MERMVICAMGGENISGVPEEIKLIPLGKVKSQKGDFIVDKESFEMIQKQFRSRRLDIVIDYEHQTLKDVQAPASGWIKDLILGEDAIIGKVEWTDQAKKYLSNKEYRYLSPVVIARKSDKKVIGLHSVALTNTPAIDGMFAIVNSIDEKSFEGGENSMELEKLIEMLGLADNATEEDVMAAIRELQGKAADLKEKACTETVANSTILSMLGLQDTAKTEDVLVAIASLKTGSSTDAEIQALKRRIEERDANDAVEAAMKSGKVSAAMKDWAKEYALKDPAGFKSFVEKSPVVVPMGKMETKEAKGSDTSDVDDATAFACKQIGVSEEDIKKYGGKN